MRLKDSNLLNNIYLDIIRDKKITEEDLANKYMVNERTIRRYIKILKDNKKVKLKGKGKKKVWEV